MPKFSFLNFSLCCSNSNAEKYTNTQLDFIVVSSTFKDSWEEAIYAGQHFGKFDGLFTPV